ncbi:MAG TPA: hypothetical protein DDW87_02105, partial [Firmicutes bacterium]|nr:hypothetical protein [Bacillota bacterium]
MNQADPRVKLLWTLLCTTGALLFVRPGWMASLCLFTLAGTLFLGADLGSFALRLKRFVPLFLMIGVVQMLFTRTGRPVVLVQEYTMITLDGLLRAMTMAMRFFIILCAASVMARENSRRVIAALTKMGVPYLFSFMLLTALRFLPVFRVAFSDALTAIQLRGIDP